MLHEASFNKKIEKMDFKNSNFDPLADKSPN